MFPLELKLPFIKLTILLHNYISLMPQLPCIMVKFFLCVCCENDPVAKFCHGKLLEYFIVLIYNTLCNAVCTVTADCSIRIYRYF